MRNSLPKPRVIRGVLLAVAAALIAACDLDSLVFESNDVSVELRAAGDTLVAGGTITIEIIIANTSEAKREVNYSNSACPLNVELTGGLVPQPAHIAGSACIAILDPHILGPGEQDVTTYPFDGMAWQAPSPLGPETWVELSPGTYEMVAEIVGAPPELGGSPGVRSAPVTIEILP